MTRIRSLAARALLALLLPAAPALHAQDKVVFATNWKAQAAHGGFYQALVDGTYRKAGLEVTIQQGGPQVNNRPLLPAGKIDFLMTGNLLHSFDNVKNGLPITVVAASALKVNCPLSQITNSQELQQWLDALRASAQAELDQGHRISL